MSRDSYFNKLSPVISSLALLAARLFLDFIQWAEPLRVEPTLREGRLVRARIVEADEVDADFAGRPCGAHSDFHLADDINHILFGERDVKLGDVRVEPVIHAHDFLSDDHAVILLADTVLGQAQSVLCKERASHCGSCFYGDGIANLLHLFPLVFAGENVVRWEAHAGRELVWLEHTQKDVHLSNGLLRPSIHQPAAVIFKDSLYGTFDLDLVHPGHPRLD